MPASRELELCFGYAGKEIAETGLHSCEMGALASSSDNALQQLSIFEVRLGNLAAVVGTAAIV